MGYGKCWGSPAAVRVRVRVRVGLGLVLGLTCSALTRPSVEISAASASSRCRARDTVSAILSSRWAAEAASMIPASLAAESMTCSEAGRDIG